MREKTKGKKGSKNRCRGQGIQNSSPNRTSTETKEIKRLMLRESVQLVGCHASGEGRADVLGNVWADLESLASAAKATTNTGTLALSCGRVLHVVGTGLAKGKGLGLQKLWARLDLGHAALASLFMALVVHLDIVLGEAFARLLTVKAAVATV